MLENFQTCFDFNTNKDEGVQYEVQTSDDDSEADPFDIWKEQAKAKSLTNKLYEQIDLKSKKFTLVQEI